MSSVVHIREIVPTLLIEDDDGSIMALEAALEDAPCFRYNIMTAKTLQEALELLVRVPFELVILDLKLPDAKDMEAIKKIRQEHPEVPLVVWTGTEDEAMEEAAFALNVDSYLVKAKHNTDDIRWIIRTAIVAHKAGRRFKPLDAVIKKAEETLKKCETDSCLPSYDPPKLK